MATNASLIMSNPEARLGLYRALRQKTTGPDLAELDSLGPDGFLAKNVGVTLSYITDEYNVRLPSGRVILVDAMSVREMMREQMPSTVPVTSTMEETRRKLQQTDLNQVQIDHILRTLNEERPKSEAEFLDRIQRKLKDAFEPQKPKKNEPGKPTPPPDQSRELAEASQKNRELMAANRKIGRAHV